MKSKADSILEELESARDKPESIVTDGCPVRFLREIKEDGTELFIGDIGIYRCKHGELMGPNGLDWDKYEEENTNWRRVMRELFGVLEVRIGNAKQGLRTVDFLIGSHHGRGWNGD